MEREAERAAALAAMPVIVRYLRRWPDIDLEIVGWALIAELNQAGVRLMQEAAA